jgi:hypothetical protein
MRRRRLFIPRKEGVEEALAANPSITVLQEVITSADGVTTAEVAQEKIQSASVRPYESGGRHGLRRL